MQRLDDGPSEQRFLSVPSSVPTIEMPLDLLLLEAEMKPLPATMTANPSASQTWPWLLLAHSKKTDEAKASQEEPQCSQPCKWLALR